jgi:putative flippase GtrA
MRLINIRIQLLKRLSHSELRRFLIAGMINTLVGYFIYVFLLLIVKYTYAYLISFVLSVCFSYWINSRFVFRVRMSIKSMFRYPIVYSVQIMFSMVMMYLLVEKLFFPKIIAPLIVVAITVPISFILSRKIMNKN